MQQPEPQLQSQSQSQSQPETFDLGAWLGANKSQGARTVGEYIAKCQTDQNFTDERLAALMRHHPSRDYTCRLTFRRCVRAPYKKMSLFVVARDGTLMESSWRKCVDQFFGKYCSQTHRKTHVLEAMRGAVYTESGKFRTAHRAFLGNTQFCAECGQMGKLTVDHKGVPFSQIVDQWFGVRGIRGFEGVGLRFANNVYVMANKAVEKDWVEFHDEVAEFEGLCASCNSSKGSGGYRHGKGAKKATFAEPVLGMPSNG
jgi:hypothetical protein